MSINNKMNITFSKLNTFLCYLGYKVSLIWAIERGPSRAEKIFRYLSFKGSKSMNEPK